VAGTTLVVLAVVAAENLGPAARTHRAAVATSVASTVTHTEFVAARRSVAAGVVAVSRIGRVEEGENTEKAAGVEKNTEQAAGVGKNTERAVVVEAAVLD
jgi:hypothetical protein